MTIITRPKVVEGRTYKIREGHADGAIYVTINQVETDVGLRPIEIFINTKNPKAYQWTAALTRTLSALMRTGNFEFILEELAQVADPEGSYFDDRKQWDSIVQHVSHVIREHCNWLAVRQ